MWQFCSVLQCVAVCCSICKYTGLISRCVSHRRATRQVSQIFVIFSFSFSISIYILTPYATMPTGRRLTNHRRQNHIPEFSPVWEPAVGASNDSALVAEQRLAAKFQRSDRLFHFVHRGYAGHSGLHQGVFPIKRALCSNKRALHYMSDI